MKGLGIRWLCPDCGRVLDKPPYVIEGARYHSVHCKRAMTRVRVSLLDTSEVCSCGNRYDGNNFCMPSACQEER